MDRRHPQKTSTGRIEMNIKTQLAEIERLIMKQKQVREVISDLKYKMEKKKKVVKDIYYWEREKAGGD